MFHLVHLGSCGQQLVQVAAPVRWVSPTPKATNCGPIKDSFDAPAYTIGRFRFCRPDGLEYLHHFCSVDAINWQCTEDWFDVTPKRRVPLCCMLFVAPAGFMRSD